MAFIRPIITITLFIFFCQVLIAQQKTEAYFGMTNRLEWARDVMELYDKGYYISGGIEDDEFNNGWNIKTDINLEMIYDKVLGHDLSTVAIFAAVSDENGNIYITGFTTYPEQWPFVTKLDSCGNKEWCKILEYTGEFEDGTAKDIIINKNNEIVVLVKFDSEEEIDVIHLIGLNTYGDVLWTNPYASKNDYSWIREPLAYDLEEINNEYLISGHCYWPYPDDTTHWFLRPLFIGIDSLFEEKWILPFAPLDSIFGIAYNTIPINDSIIMGVGMRRLGSPEESGLLMFFDTDGVELGYREITKEQIGSNVSQIYFLEVERINDSLFILASPIGINNEYAPHCELIVDTSANIYNYAIHENVIGQQKITKTFDNNFVVIGGIEETKGDRDIYVYKIDENLQDVPFDPTPHNYDTLCPGGIQSGTTDLSDCLVWTNIGDAPSPKEYYASIKQIPIIAYPNPASEGKITFEFENTEHHNNIELKCFDLYSNEILTKKVYRYQTEAVVDISAIKEGMYVTVVYSNGWPVGDCKFVVQ